MRADGYRVITTATAWRTVESLTGELGGEGRALDSWRTLSENGGTFIDDRTVLIVDEAGQLGVRATHAILTEALRRSEPDRGKIKVILCGDAAQLKPIAAGAGVELVRPSADGTALRQVVRQRDPAMRRVIEQRSHGDIFSAYEGLEHHDCIVDIADRRGAVTTAVDTWFAAREVRPDTSHLLIARTNATVRALNNEVRKRLRHGGQIGGSNIVIIAGTSSGDPFNLALASGDCIRFGRRCALGDYNVINGTTAKIEQIEREGEVHARITARIGRARVSFSTSELADENGHVRLAHDYATTVYASQGLTAESCTVLVDPSYDRHSLYVSASRARGQTRLIVDQSAIDAIIVADRPYNQRRNEVTSAERRATLVARLSRAQHKTSTLERADLAASAARSQTSNERPKQRIKKELGHEL
jgi:ATP-dependent exoDNAse (exonuclease V) alpha subunit